MADGIIFNPFFPFHPPLLKRGQHLRPRYGLLPETTVDPSGTLTLLLMLHRVFIDCHLGGNVHKTLLIPGIVRRCNWVTKSVKSTGLLLVCGHQSDYSLPSFWTERGGVG